MSLSADVTTLPSFSGRFNLYFPRLKLSKRGARVLFAAVAAAAVLPAAACTKIT